MARSCLALSLLAAAKADNYRVCDFFFPEMKVPHMFMAYTNPSSSVTIKTAEPVRWNTAIGDQCLTTIDDAAYDGPDFIPPEVRAASGIHITAKSCDDVTQSGDVFIPVFAHMDYVQLWHYKSGTVEPKCIAAPDPYDSFGIVTLEPCSSAHQVDFLLWVTECNPDMQAMNTAETALSGVVAAEADYICHSVSDHSMNDGCFCLTVLTDDSGIDYVTSAPAGTPGQDFTLKWLRQSHSTPLQRNGKCIRPQFEANRPLIMGECRAEGTLQDFHAVPASADFQLQWQGALDGFDHAVQRCLRDRYMGDDEHYADYTECEGATEWQVHSEPMCNGVSSPVHVV